MDGLTLFGLFAVSAMLLCYALEDRSHWFILAFAVACALGSFTDSCRAPGRSGWSKPSGPGRAAALECQAASRHSSCAPAVLVGGGPSATTPAASSSTRNEQTMWPDRRLLDLFKTEFPIVLAPMAGIMDADL